MLQEQNKDFAEWKEEDGTFKPQVIFDGWAMQDKDIEFELNCLTYKTFLNNHLPNLVKEIMECKEKLGLGQQKLRILELGLETD